MSPDRYETRDEIPQHPKQNHEMALDSRVESVDISVGLYSKIEYINSINKSATNSADKFYFDVSDALSHDSTIRFGTPGSTEWIGAGLKARIGLMEILFSDS